MQLQEHLTFRDILRLTFSQGALITESTRQREGRSHGPRNGIANENESREISVCVCVCARMILGIYKMRSTRGTLEVQLRACFVPSYNYLQVTYLKGRLVSSPSLHRGRRTYTRYVSVQVFMCPRRGCGFAFNCERDSSQPAKYRLVLSRIKTSQEGEREREIYILQFEN